ncbi:MAG: GGDEF domain-containing protein [Oscillospiraceae bacterium]|nr:GGDEF domain-containing protein [Oscillospiraceae bacterium]
MKKEYTAREMRRFLEEMSGKVDLARVVDPIECRILDILEDGTISRNKKCYGIWNSDQKCLNCSSALACRTGCSQKKAERFRNQVFYIESNPVMLKLEDGSAYEAVVELVTVGHEDSAEANDREAENEGGTAARYMARHDPLTNALYSESFYELARERIRSCPDASWVMVTCNIMHFQLINTLFGVLKGNEVLIRTSSMLREAADGADGLCGRLGADQFALLLPREAYSEEKLLNISRILTEDFNSGIYTFCIHFGVYEIDDSSVPVSVMCGRANTALRTIREDRTHTVAYFNDSILRKILFEQQVIGGFEEALQNGQFHMYLQPLVGKNGRVIGAEALARWCRPDGTVLMPGDFIEILEHAGLIPKLDLYIWELAVRTLCRWKETDLRGLSISVNMSAKDFYSINVYDSLTSLTEKYGIDNRLLRLEITETALLVDPEKSNEVVSRLREKGFLVEIDDFGKGFSSLSLLKNLQADVLKIDMSFLREIHDRERSRIILQAVINLADALEMDVITEGVETLLQFESLVDMGCRHFQGYYFSRPVPVEEFERIAAMKNE